MSNSTKRSYGLPLKTRWGYTLLQSWLAFRRAAQAGRASG